MKNRFACWTLFLHHPGSFRRTARRAAHNMVRSYPPEYIGMRLHRSRERIEVLLRRCRTCLPRVATSAVAVTAVVLAALLAAGSMTPSRTVFAQSTPRPSFEVASVKLSGPDDRLMYRFQPGGRYLATGVTLKMLIASAYSVPEFLISGGPGWRDSDKYNIDAKVGSPLPPWPDSNKQLGLMFQSLLEDRFKLALHREIREEPVYDLLVAKGGAKLKLARADESAGFESMTGRIHSMAVPLEYLARSLGFLLGRQVIDKTGLAGAYSYTVTFTPDDVPTADDNSPSIFTAVQEQLGLKLESNKGRVEVLVIDHVEKPSAN
jgi:uncharacterized protein (TIGR03435 family)